MDIIDIFSKNLHRIRTEKDITQEELAEMTKLHRTYISLLEQKKRNPTIKTIQILANGLGVEPYEFLLEEEEEC